MAIVGWIGPENPDSNRLWGAGCHFAVVPGVEQQRKGWRNRDCLRRPKNNPGFFFLRAAQHLDDLVRSLGAAGAGAETRRLAECEEPGRVRRRIGVGPG